MADQNDNGQVASNTGNGDGSSSENQARFEIRQVFLKDVSFESPKAPEVFTATDFSPEINVQMNINHRTLSESDGFYEVVLAVTVGAKFQEDDVFLCEIHQAGVFLLTGIPATDLPQIFEVHCANVLLPFAREAIDDLVIKGGFPALRIHPVNFEAIFRQRQAAGPAAGEAS